MGFLNSEGLAYFWSKIKALVDTKANASHTHNYAGSSSAGGSANLLYLPRVTEDANYSPGANRVETKEFTSVSSNLPSSNYYHILTAQGSDNKYETQLALCMTSSSVQYRNKINNSWLAWKRLSFPYSISKSDTTITLTEAYTGSKTSIDIADIDGGTP